MTSSGWKWSPSRLKPSPLIVTIGACEVRVPVGELREDRPGPTTGTRSGATAARRRSRTSSPPAARPRAGPPIPRRRGARAASAARCRRRARRPRLVLPAAPCSARPRPRRRCARSRPARPRPARRCRARSRPARSRPARSRPARRGRARRAVLVGRGRARLDAGRPRQAPRSPRRVSWSCRPSQPPGNHARQRCAAEPGRVARLAGRLRASPGARCAASPAWARRAGRGSRRRRTRARAHRVRRVPPGVGGVGPPGPRRRPGPARRPTAGSLRGPPSSPRRSRRACPHPASSPDRNVPEDSSASACNVPGPEIVTSSVESDTRPCNLARRTGRDSRSAWRDDSSASASSSSLVLVAAVMSASMRSTESSSAWILASRSCAAAVTSSTRRSIRVTLPSSLQLWSSRRPCPPAPGPSSDDTATSVWLAADSERSRHVRPRPRRTPPSAGGRDRVVGLDPDRARLHDERASPDEPVVPSDPADSSCAPSSALSPPTAEPLPALGASARRGRRRAADEQQAHEHRGRCPGQRGRAGPTSGAGHAATVGGRAPRVRCWSDRDVVVTGSTPQPSLTHRARRVRRPGAER